MPISGRQRVARVKNIKVARQKKASFKDKGARDSDDEEMLRKKRDRVKKLKASKKKKLKRK